MTYITLLLLSALFIELFILFKINDSVKSMLQVSRDAYSIIMSTELDEDEKERSIRRASLEIFKITLTFFVKFMIVLLALYVLYEILSSLFSLSAEQLIEVSFLPQTILLLILIGFLYIRLRSVIIRRL
jgi:hypothetical protein